ncbi:MAG: hypothetical protein AB1483_05115 [Candidatus Zixiibacteriota bacterium]
MKRSYSAIILLLTVSIGIFVVNCSKDAETPQDVGEFETDTTTQTYAIKDPVTVTDTISYVLNEAMTRLRYKDKSGLYDNEFEYYRAQNDFDQYLNTRQMEFAQADTLTFLEVIEAKLHEHDSATVDLYIHYEGPLGDHHQDRDTIVVYYHDGRWLKPTMSKIEEQLKWEKTKGGK